MPFDWVAFVTWAKPLIPILDFAYRTYPEQSLLIVFALFYTRNDLRAWQLTAAAYLSLIICSAVFAFFPAESAMMHYGVYPTADHEAVVSGPLIYHVKSGARVVTPSMLRGLITFPSYHACVAAMLSWSAWPVKLVRWPAILLNLFMAVSCIVVGSHYLVDVIGGAVVAAISITIAVHLVRRRTELTLSSATVTPAQTSSSAV